MRPTLAALAALALASIAGADLAQPGPHKAGIRSVTVTRANGTTFAATLHYPASAEGLDAPFDTAGAPYAGITFGHGFVQPVTQYASTLKHLATHGFVVIAAESEGGLFPNHGNLAKDLRGCLDWLEQQNALAGGPFEGGIDLGRLGACGHSMGGGAAILAAKEDSRLDALATLAAADTNPSSIGAMSAVAVPVRLIAGSADTIVPLATSTTPMYDNADAPRQKLVIAGGFHCGFTDANFLFCDSGTITRAEQLAIVRRQLAEFFLLHLDGDQAPWPVVWGTAPPSPTEATLERDPGVTVVVDPASIEAIPGVRISAIVTVTNTGPQPTAFALAAESATGWTLTFTPAVTGPVATGSSTTVTLTAIASGGAAALSTAVSARRELDGATRGWVALHLAPGMPTPDLNGDGTVDGADLGVLLAAWGAGASAADLNEDGGVDGADLGILLTAW